MLTTTDNPKSLGNLSFGSPYNFVYAVKNEGDKAVEINTLIVDCGACTKASMNKSFFAPGDSGVVEVMFTPGSTGINRKGIRVLYTPLGGLQQELKLTFQGNVS